MALSNPSVAELTHVASAFGLPALAVEDAIHAHQRPKLESHEHVTFVALKTATYVDSEEVIELGEVMTFLGDNFVVTVERGATDEMELTRKLLATKLRGPAADPVEVFYRLTDVIVDGYLGVLPKLDVDIDEIQTDVFSSAHRRQVERIFRLKREVLSFRQAVEPLTSPLEELLGGLDLGTRDISTGLAARFRDVHDHVQRVFIHIRGIDSLLDSALHAHATQVGMQQNEDMRKISAWAAIAAVPTAIGAVYGMNFESMPELHSAWGYPASLTAMAAGSFLLYRRFKRKGWL